MASKESRITEKRQYQGQKTAEELAKWLNFTDDNEGRRRIVRIMELVARLAPMTAAPLYRKELAEEIDDVFKKMEVVKKELDEALRNYHAYPKICFELVPGTDAVEPLVFWEPFIGRARMREVERISKRKSFSKQQAAIRKLLGAEMDEMSALRSVLELVASGAFFSVRKCVCGKYFFGKFAHQRFCSQKCRIAEFRSSDEARRKRNEYARKLYHLHKTGKVK